jgi:phage gp29-like protein
MASNGNGSYPAGSIADTPFATPIPAEQLAQAYRDAVGGVDPDRIPRNDEAFQPPHDPLAGSTIKRDPRLVYRDLPLVVVQNSWTVEATRAALATHMQGIFELSGQLVDSILGDDRVQATLGSRISGLFGRDVRHTPADDSDEARECCDAWEKHWPEFASSYALPESHAYAILMGWSTGQILWDTAGEVWKPYARPWHPRFTYYHWPARKYVAISQDGTLPITPGDGRWFLHAPFGQYRGWVRGAIRAVAEPWLIRHFAIRDWARYSEVHGLPTRIGYTPAAADPGERAKFETSLANLGSESAMLIPRGVDAQNGYDYELREASAGNWEAFPGLIDRCDMSIVLSLLFQNLTTEVQGGSFAATTAHMDIREQGLEADNFGWLRTLHRDFQRPFAYLNFGDAALAPTTCWDVQSRARYKDNGAVFQQFATALGALRTAGIVFDNPDAIRTFAAERLGLVDLPSYTIKDPPAAPAATPSAKPPDAPKEP